jgi:hypothetical protein
MYRFHVDVDVPPAVGVKMTRIGPDGGGGGKTHSLLFAFLIIGVVLGFSFLASAKPQKFKLTIEGGRLSKPIEVTDPQILELSYFRLPAPQPPDGLHGYRISIYFRVSDDEIRRMAVLYYYPNVPGAQGFIYSPFQGEAWDVRDLGKVVSEGRPRRWSYASPQWEQAIKPLIANAERAEATNHSPQR